MEVHFTPELQARLEHVAAQQGRDTEALIREAVERLVEYEAWFAAEVEEGLAAAGRGEFTEHEEVGNMIATRYPG